MAGMKRFVTYIYAYEERKKGNNTGFAKVEIRGGEVRLEIHLRGVYAAQGECRIYLFRENAGDMEGVAIGKMTLANGSGGFGIILKAGQLMDTPFGITDMDGILLFTQDERIFLSRWKEGGTLTVDREHFREWKSTPAGEAVEQPQEPEIAEPRREKKPAEPPREPESAGQRGEAEAVVPSGEMKARRQSKEMEAHRQSGEPEAAEQPTVPAASREAAGMDLAKSPDQTAPDENSVGTMADRKTENVQATEIPMRNIFPEYNWDGIWENLCAERDVLAPFEDGDARCVRIELKDLRELPQKYWYLGNNSFLLHGFFNYRYLVVGRTGENRWFLGVPGIYQRQERVMAAIFGFPEFLAAALPDGETAGEEPVNRFGCWCRYIEE